MLRKWGLHFRVIGEDVAASGTKDENLISLLHQLSGPTFFSLDRRFSRSELLHRNYALAFLDVRASEAALFIRRYLKHPDFDTQRKRMGTVARVHAGGIHFRKIGDSLLVKLRWAT